MVTRQYLTSGAFSPSVGASVSWSDGTSVAKPRSGPRSGPGPPVLSPEACAPLQQPGPPLGLEGFPRAARHWCPEG